MRKLGKSLGKEEKSPDNHTKATSANKDLRNVIYATVVQLTGNYAYCTQ